MLNLISYRFSRDDLMLKPGRVSGQSALCLVYADTRAYQDALDSFGIVWGTTVQAVGPKAAIVTLTIDGVTRSASAEDTDLMSAEARAFKRACSAWGLGRYIYDLDLGFQPWDGKRFGQAAYQALTKALRAIETPQNAPQGDAVPPSEADDDLDKLNKHFHALGTELYGDMWGKVRQRNAKRVSGGRTDSSKDLTPDEIQTLINGMNQVKAKRLVA